MYRKTVRRRRAVLALLVALSLILLTAYFGESPGGRLHAVQRDFLTIISPIQSGANAALKPVRDAFGWIGDTLNARSQRDAARAQLRALRREVVASQAERQGYHELLRLFHLDNQAHLSQYTPVSATVVGKSPNFWYSTVTIDKGTGAGVRVNDPVVNGEGLVGKVTLAASDGAQVSLITDSAVEVTAKVNMTGTWGILEPKVGEPGDLAMQYLPASASVAPGQYIVTNGTISREGESLFPPGIPIGQVTSVNEESPFKLVNVRPLAELRNLDVVQVLTYAHRSRPERLATLAASLPPGGQGGQSGEGSGSGSGTGQVAQAGAQAGGGG
ncbi:MAG: rod shape-determining protein MreC [Solirubrobacterales bacterium]|nr:rod shape-determining protein MreC [Solirubrobacterales bacterium]